MIAQEITPRVQQWLRKSQSPRVLHLFEEVCTLANEHGEVLSLVSPAVGLGPFTAVLAYDFTAGLDVHQPVTLDAERQTLTVGPLFVDTSGSAIWEPKPDWSLLQNADMGKWPAGTVLPASMEVSLKLTIDGITANDSMACVTGVRGLAGRGSGLTPAGDDVLVGILYALWVWYPHHRRRTCREWMELIRAAAVSRTTTLAANFIQAAAEGEATWQWHDLVYGRPDAIERLLAIGHTSGADAWAGFKYTVAMLRPARAGTPDGS